MTPQRSRPAAHHPLPGHAVAGAAQRRQGEADLPRGARAPGQERHLGVGGDAAARDRPHHAVVDRPRPTEAGGAASLTRFHFTGDRPALPLRHDQDPRPLSLAAALSLAALTAGCGFQSIPQANNAVAAAWAEVENQYQRRADLVPNLVETVKGYAAHERETLEAVMAARAKATQVQLTADDLTPENMKRFEEAQRGLRGALGRLLVVAEAYPQLKANENFRDLQVQLEGTENRIAVARQRYVDAGAGLQRPGDRAAHQLHQQPLLQEEAEGPVHRHHRPTRPRRPR